jgi:hypothetical protein
MKLSVQMLYTLEQKLNLLKEQDVPKVFSYLDYLIYLSDNQQDMKYEAKSANTDIDSILNKYAGSATHIWKHQDANDYISNLRADDRF